MAATDIHGQKAHAATRGLFVCRTVPPGAACYGQV